MLWGWKPLTRSVSGDGSLMASEIITIRAQGLLQLATDKIWSSKWSFFHLRVLAYCSSRCISIHRSTPGAVLDAFI